MITPMPTVLKGDEIEVPADLEGGTYLVKQSSNNNYQSVTGLEVGKWYGVWAFQYSPYTNFHGVWSESQLRALTNVGDVIFFGSWNQNNYNITCFLFKATGTSLSTNLGYSIQYRTVN